MGSEQRRFDRIPETFRARCRALGALQEPWQAVATKDLSAGGMSFQSESFFDEGERVELNLQLPGIAEELILLGCVARATLTTAGLTELAVEFVDVSPGQQARIDELVQFLKKSSRHDEPGA